MTHHVEYNTSEKGLRTILTDWQEAALRIIWANPGGIDSWTVWVMVNEYLKPKTISRASIINFLEAMRDADILDGVEVTGKGGLRWIYTPAMNEREFKNFIISILISHLLRNFPNEIRLSMTKLNNILWEN
jgi:hypothetical protein